MNTPTRNSFLLCVDMQPVFINAVADGARIRRRCEFTLAAAAGLGLPVGFTEQVPQKLGGTDPALRVLAADAPAWSKSTFAVLADEAIRDALLRKRQVSHVLICGVETPVCVYQTAQAALAAGLEVTVLADAVGARRPDDARICLRALAHHGAHVLPAETVIYALLQDANHPYFRAYTRLVKEHGAATGSPGGASPA